MTHSHMNACKKEVKDIMLKYPAYDPATAKELFGVILPGEAQPVEGGEASLVSPKGRSFHNGRFVQRLRERALAEPNVTVIEGIVSKLLQVEEGRRVHDVCAARVESSGGLAFPLGDRARAPHVYETGRAGPGDRRGVQGGQGALPL